MTFPFCHEGLGYSIVPFFFQKPGAVQGESHRGVQLQLLVYGDGHGARVRQQRPHVLLALPRGLCCLLFALQLH